MNRFPIMRLSAVTRCVKPCHGFLLALVFALTPLSAAAQRAKPCNDIILAAFAWDSAQLAAEMLNTLLRDGLNCQVRREAADPDGVAQAFERGAPWLVAPGAVAPPPPIAARDSVLAGVPLFGEGETTGFFASSWALDMQPNVASLDDLRAEAARFAPRPGARPTLFLCPTAWTCHQASREAAANARLGDVFDIVTPRSGDAVLEAMDRAARARRPWVGVFWTPSAQVMRYKLRRISALPACGDADCATNANARSVVLFSSALQAAAPRAAKIFSSFTASAAVVSQALAWRQANNADLADTADYIFTAEPKIWRALLDFEERVTFERALRRRLAESE